ncbi:unnamed protein product [Cuscuta europaea]|nr:unnamed protein product [Cuscuta europaea]
MLAFESQHYLKRKTRGKMGFVSLKLDMSKAYDRVEWTFLEGMMRHLGFAEMWINLIMECVTSVTYSIPFDESELGPIFPTRGLRQGDPLSPYLFLIVAEGLSALLRHSEETGRLHGVAVARGAPQISHLLFADDSLLFFKATHGEASLVKEILHDYEMASGQMINLNKSRIFFSPNVPNEHQVGLIEMLGVGLAGEEERYLGLPAMVGRSKRKILDYLRQRIVNRIQSWNNQFLSRAGREVLLKSVVQAMPNYAMNVFLFPKDLCREMEVLMNAFWWMGQSGKGIKWRSWDFSCKPKKLGGMGFKKIRDFNLSMLAKQAWRLFTEPETLVARVFKTRYYPKGTFLTAKIGHNPSFIWYSIFQTQGIIKDSYYWRVGNGESINVWSEPWLPDGINPKV